MSIKLVVTWLLVVGVAIRADTTAKIEDDDDDTKNKPSYVVTDEAWFEVEIRDLEGPGMHYRGRFEVGLFGEIVPMTTMNFVGICKGYKSGKTVLQYKNSPIHRIVKDFVVQMGDVTVGDGTGGTSIFGEKFNDENFILSHRSPGMVSMANKGKDTNGSQFFITMVKARWMDGKHVVFGKVLKGFDVVKTLNEVPTVPESSWPTKKMKVLDCGINTLTKKYELTDKQLDSVDDLE